MMKIIYLALLFFILLLPQSANCQEMKYSDFNNSFGVKASNMSGYGVYYNRKLTDDVYLQVMGLAYYLYSMKDKVEHTNFNYDIGLEIQRNIIRDNNFRFFILAGAYYYFDDDRYDGNASKSYLKNNSYNAGVGIAAEFHYKRFIFAADLGYKFFEDRLEHTEDNAVYPELRRVTKVGAGFGIGFLF